MGSDRLGHTEVNKKQKCEKNQFKADIYLRKDVYNEERCSENNYGWRKGTLGSEACTMIEELKKENMKRRPHFNFYTVHVMKKSIASERGVSHSEVPQKKDLNLEVSGNNKN